MEILALLRLNAKRLTALATIGVLTGALAAAAVSRQPTSYQASTIVFVGQALPAGSSVFDLSPLVADFSEAVQLPQVRQAAADQLGLPVSEVRASTRRSGTDSSSVEVLASSESAPRAEQVSQATATVAMNFLSARQLERADSLQQERQAAVEEAQTVRNQLLITGGGADPELTYLSLLERVNTLTLDASDPTLDLTPEERAEAAAEAARLRSTLPETQAVAERYRVARSQLEDAEANLSEARQLRAAAEATQLAATAERAVAPGETIAESQIALMVQAFAAAVVATFIAGIAFFFAVDGARRRSRNPQPATVAPARVSAPPASTPAASAPAASAPAPMVSSSQGSSNTRSTAASPRAGVPTAQAGTAAAPTPTPVSRSESATAPATAAPTPAKAVPAPARTNRPVAQRGGTSAASGGDWRSSNEQSSMFSRRRSAVNGKDAEAPEGPGRDRGNPVTEPATDNNGDPPAAKEGSPEDRRRLGR